MKQEVNLVDRIYEAAVVPELWRDVLVDLADRMDTHTAAVFSVVDDSYQWITTPNAEELFQAFSVSPEVNDNLRPSRALDRAPGIFVRDSDIMTPEEMARDGALSKHVYARGLKWTAGCAIREPSGHTVVFDMSRRNDQPAFSDDDLSRMNALKPDLARAAFLTSRLGFQQAQTIARALAMVGLPAAVLGDRGTVIAMNDDMEALSPVISTRAGNRLHFARPATRQLVEQAIAGLASQAAPGVQSIPVPAQKAMPATILHLIPVRRSARDVFTRSMAVLVATPVGRNGPPDMRVLCGLFDLTPAESRLAREIALGISPNDAAARLGLSIETVRTQLKRVMAKTGTGRQAELAALLAGLSPLV